MNARSQMHGYSTEFEQEDALVGLLAFLWNDLNTAAEAPSRIHG